MHGITALILSEHDEAFVREFVDDTIGDYIDEDAVQNDYNGSIEDWYKANGNRAAENQVLSWVLSPYADTLDDITIDRIKHELAEAWSLQS